ncbi:MAG: hypothetical protein P8P49_00385 [Opitutales bacterium]|nr:hypothetical protein [Opitutales bacterium]MDG1324192.1 hypothetical protein [Opitutales bacterium]
MKYTDGSISVTIWFDEDNSIFAFEVIFDLLMNEVALLYSKKSPLRFVNIDHGISKPGRTVKQSIGTERLQLTSARVNEFKRVSESLPDNQREFILQVMYSLKGQT